MIPVTQVVVDQKSAQRLMVNLRVLPRRIGIKVFRIALNAWGGVVRDKARELVREESGLLKKSLSVKVVIPAASYDVKHHGKPAYVLVGPARKSGKFLRRKNLRGLGKAMTLLRKLRKDLGGFGIHPLARERTAVGLTQRQFASALFRNPTRYAHLLEKGHAKGKGRSAARPYPFIAPAARAGEGAGFNKFAEKMRAGIESEAAALASK